MLLEFGFKPYKKPAQPTAAERVANAEKKAANPSTPTNPGPSNHAA